MRPISPRARSILASWWSAPVLYELLTGQRPFTADSDLGLLRQVVRGRLVPPRELAAWIPEPLERIVLKAMARDPRQRYQVAKALAQDIHLLLDAAGDRRTTSDLGLLVGSLFPDDPQIPAEMQRRLASARGTPSPLVSGLGFGSQTRDQPSYEVSYVEEELMAARARLIQLEAELAPLRRLEAELAPLRRLEAELAPLRGLEAELGLARRRSSELEGSAGQLQKRNAELEVALAEARARAAQLARERAGLDAELERARAAAAALEPLRAKLSSSNATLEESNGARRAIESELWQKVQQHEQQLEGVTRQKDTLSQQLAALGRERDSFDRQLGAAKAEQEALAARVNQGARSEKERARLAAKLVEAEQRAEQAGAEAASLRDELLGARESRDAFATSTAQALQARVAELEQDRALLKARVVELEAVAASLKQLERAAEERQELAIEIDRLKRKLAETARGLEEKDELGQRLAGLERDRETLLAELAGHKSKRDEHVDLALRFEVAQEQLRQLEELRKELLQLRPAAAERELLRQDLQSLSVELASLRSERIVAGKRPPSPAIEAQQTSLHETLLKALDRLANNDQARGAVFADEAGLLVSGIGSHTEAMAAFAGMFAGVGLRATQLLPLGSVRQLSIVDENTLTFTITPVASPAGDLFLGTLSVGPAPDQAAIDRALKG